MVPAAITTACFASSTPKLEAEARFSSVLCGASKPFRTEFPDAVYERALAMGGEYLARNPRSLA